MAALAILCGYLVGAFPTGLFVARAKGINIRAVGSGNIGFTNIWRVMGAVPGLIVLVIDVGKAFSATWWFPDFAKDSWEGWLTVSVGVAVLIGNQFNIFLGGGGGKGVAAGLGVFLALAPKATGVTLLVFALLLWTTRYMSLASLLAAVVLVIASCFWSPMPVRVAASLATVVITIKHRANIARLVAGTERKFGRPGSEAGSAG